MAIIFRSLLRLLLGSAMLLFFSCRTQQFADNGYFTGEVDKYFNEKEGVNIWLYRAFQPSHSGNTGLKTNSFYPVDQRIMKLAGLGKRGDRVLFSVVPETKPFYNMIAIKHKKRRFNTAGFDKKEYQNALYFQKDYSSEGMTIRHVYIPYGKKNSLSLLFYALDVEGSKGNMPVDKFEYLAKINALELKEEVEYKTTWQIFDCEMPERKDWVIHPKTELLKGRKTIYLKLYDIYGPNKSISFFKLLNRKDAEPIHLSLCPNEYVLEYYNEKGEFLESEGFSVVK